ncbi:MAG: LTA synthase family protein [Elusimicrobiota bacterium]
MLKTSPSLDRFSFFHPRFLWLYIAGGLYLAGCLILRGVLLLRFGEVGALSFGTIARIFEIGLRMDLVSGFWLFLPLVLWLSATPNRIFSSKWHRIFFVGCLFLLTVFLIFIFKAEYEFFDEFNARFNTVAVDYLIYPHEVFVNLWQSYPLTRIVAACIWGGFFIFTFVGSFRLPLWNPIPFRYRGIFLAIYLLIGLAVVPTVSMGRTRFSINRVLNELSNNGEYAFVYSALTRHLDYPSFYRTLDRSEAFERVRRLVSQPGAVFVKDKDSIERLIPGKLSEKKWNVVVLLIESFGSEFWGALGRPDSLTPEMDELAKEGLLFSNLYASGNRTVRGIEGVLSSFPPLPGDSIVKRHLSDNVSTIARTLKDQKYSTVYLYGGRGLFDGMRSFAIRNGFDRFIEQKDFAKPTFTTIWGVADEDLYRRSVEEFRVMHERKEPFFATVLSVSNHKPYTYPKGRIPENPDQHSRSHAVKYTDWALGYFFRLAKKEKFYEDTIFVVVADHGARVYGSQSIPINSYKIPMVILGPIVKNPKRVDTLGGSLDVGPTVLGLFGVPYKSVFFGRDLFSIPQKDTWAVMQHNRDVGLYHDGKMAVLGLNKTAEYYRMNSNDLQLVAPIAEDNELEKDTVALFQVADELYTNKKYRVNAVNGL